MASKQLLEQIQPDCLCYIHSTSHAFAFLMLVLNSTNQTQHINPCATPGPTKQPGSPNRHGHSPSARLQAARSFFTSSRTAGCKAGHPQSVLQGLVQALHQLPADLNQGQHRNADHWSLPLTVSTLTLSDAPNKVCHHDLSASNTSCECFSCYTGWQRLDWYLHLPWHIYAATLVITHHDCQ